MYTGVQIGGKGVFTHAGGNTYRGQANDAKADGLGVITHTGGSTWSGGWSMGVSHGHAVDRTTNGTVGYWLHDRGTLVNSAWVGAGANGACVYDGQRCAADDARLLALTAAALPAAVRRTALAGRPRSAC